ncbi:hypothetical protein DRW03_21740 [Corallococcus sp. H22C18031201]|nr:hypothetical protein DRW03_21740 [Corallococcus sp. H22C18031201]
MACEAVHDVEQGATGALLLFSDWPSEPLVDQRVVRQRVSSKYRPGHFCERELPVLLAVRSQVERPPGGHPP